MSNKKLTKYRNEAMDSLEYALEKHNKWLAEYSKWNNSADGPDDISYENTLVYMKGILQDLRGMQTRVDDPYDMGADILSMNQIMDIKHTAKMIIDKLKGLRRDI